MGDKIKVETPQLDMEFLLEAKATSYNGWGRAMSNLIAKAERRIYDEHGCSADSFLEDFLLADTREEGGEIFVKAWMRFSIKTVRWVDPE